MLGTMMQFPLTLTPILECARKVFGAGEIVSRLPDGSSNRSTYADLYRRARALAFCVPSMFKADFARWHRLHKQNKTD
jgi:hypothetical protein